MKTKIIPQMTRELFDYAVCATRVHEWCHTAELFAGLENESRYLDALRKAETIFSNDYGVGMMARVMFSDESRDLSHYSPLIGVLADRIREAKDKISAKRMPIIDVEVLEGAV